MHLNSNKKYWAKASTNNRLNWTMSTSNLRQGSHASHWSKLHKDCQKKWLWKSMVLRSQPKYNIENYLLCI